MASKASSKKTTRVKYTGSGSSGRYMVCNVCRGTGMQRKPSNAKKKK